MRKPRLVFALVTGAVAVAGASAAIPAHAGGGSRFGTSPSPSATPQPAASGSRSAAPQADITTTSTAGSVETTTTAGSVETTTTGGSGESTSTAGPVETTTTVGAVCPDYGLAKARVGVQIADGSYVPDGTTTVGSTFTVTETDTVPSDCEQTLARDRAAAVAHGVTLPRLAPGVSESVTCTTGAAEPTARRSHAGETGEGTESQCPDEYTAPPGYSITVTQDTVPSGQALLVDPTSQTAPACTYPAQAGTERAAVADPPTCPADTPTLLFDDRGLPPAAAADALTVLTGDAADIEVLANDDSHGAPTSITHVGAPSHGTATVEGDGSYAPGGRQARAADGSQTVLYKPATGFVGTDRFSYTITTANGSSTATVQVRVTAPPPVAADDTAATTTGSSVTVPVTGNDDAEGGGAITITAVGDPQHGTATVEGDSIVYTPAAGFSGTDSFPYTIGTAYGTATATVTVTVDPPVRATVPTGPTLPFTGLDASLLGLTATGLVAGGAGTRLLARRRPLTRRQRRRRGRR